MGHMFIFLTGTQFCNVIYETQNQRKAIWRGCVKGSAVGERVNTSDCIGKGHEGSHHSFLMRKDGVCQDLGKRHGELLSNWGRLCRDENVLEVMVVAIMQQGRCASSHGNGHLEIAKCYLCVCV